MSAYDVQPVSETGCTDAIRITFLTCRNYFFCSDAVAVGSGDL